MPANANIPSRMEMARLHQIAHRAVAASEEARRTLGVDLAERVQQVVAQIDVSDLERAAKSASSRAVVFEAKAFQFPQIDLGKADRWIELSEMIRTKAGQADLSWLGRAQDEKRWLGWAFSAIDLEDRVHTNAAVLASQAADSGSPNPNFGLALAEAMGSVDLGAGVEAASDQASLAIKKSGLASSLSKADAALLSSMIGTVITLLCLLGYTSITTSDDPGATLMALVVGAELGHQAGKRIFVALTRDDDE